jgi:eukaryotic-like serine/threonine-protein kinase
MLSVKPEKRGTAEELAEALEQRAVQAGPEAHVPLFEWETLEREKWSPEDVASAGFRHHRLRRRWREEVQATLKAETTARAAAAPPEAEARTRTVTSDKPVKRRDQNQRWQAWLAVVAVGTVVLWPQRAGPGNTGEEFIGVRCSPDAAGREAGSVSLGDTSMISAEPPEKAPSKKVVALEVPPQPQPGQLKPDANGRCRKGLIAINGGCWLKASVDLEICAGNGYVYRGDCYVPMFPPTREPTSTPTK